MATTAAPAVSALSAHMAGARGALSTLRDQGRRVIGVVLVRRFRVAGQLTELTHLAEVPALPPRGWHIDFADGTDSGVVAWGKITLRSFSPGAHGPRVAIHMDSEPGEGLQAALDAGWEPVEGS